MAVLKVSSVFINYPTLVLTLLKLRPSGNCLADYMVQTLVTYEPSRIRTPDCPTYTKPITFIVIFFFVINCYLILFLFSLDVVKKSFKFLNSHLRMGSAPISPLVFKIVFSPMCFHCLFNS